MIPLATTYLVILAELVDTCMNTAMTLHALEKRINDRKDSFSHEIDIYVAIRIGTYSIRLHD